MGLRRPDRASIIPVAACALALAIVLALPAAALGQDLRMDLAEYARAVERARDAIAPVAGTTIDAVEAAALAEEVRSLLPVRVTLETDEGPVTIDASTVHDLSDDLGTASTAGARADALAALDAHLASLRLSLATGRGPALAEDPAALQEILAGLGVRGQSGIERWLTEALDRLARAIDEFIASLLGSRDAGTGVTVVFWTLTIAGGVAVVALIVLAVRRWLSATAPAPRRVGGTPLTDAPVVPAAEGLPEDAAAFAAEAAAAGRFREAVRALFGGAARSLVARGILDHTRTRTNAELLADLRAARPELHPALAALRGVFEPAWYGHADPGAEGYRLALTRYEEILALVAGGERG